MVISKNSSLENPHDLIADDDRSKKMKAKLSEEEVLKKLGIPDFRHMTKDKVITFVSALPDMDPEVAKKALEQFPHFKELAGDIVTQYKAVVDTAFKENRISQQAFFDTCNSIIKSLQKMLEADEIDSEERKFIIDKMLELARMIGEKDSENKGMLLKILAGVGAVFVTILSITVTIFKKQNPQDKDS